MGSCRYEGFWKFYCFLFYILDHSASIKHQNKETPKFLNLHLRTGVLLPPFMDMSVRAGFSDAFPSRFECSALMAIKANISGETQHNFEIDNHYYFLNICTSILHYLLLQFKSPYIWEDWEELFTFDANLDST